MEIIIYSKNNCVFCTGATKHMEVKSLDLDYTEKKMAEFDSPIGTMLEDINKQVRTMNTN